MLRSIEGVYRKGKVELTEVPSDHAPCWLGYFPVIMEARVGVQVGLGQ